MKTPESKSLNTVAGLRKEAKRHGATVHDNSTPKQYDYGIEAPPGTVWQCAEVHELVVNGYKPDAEAKREAIADAIDRMSEGTMPCPNAGTTEGCEWCGVVKPLVVKELSHGD